MKNRYIPNYKTWNYDEKRLKQNAMTQLLTKYAGADAWLGSIDPDYTRELDEARVRLQRVRSAIVRHIVQIERKKIVPMGWDWDYNIEKGRWKWEDDESMIEAKP